MTKIAVLLAITALGLSACGGSTKGHDPYAAKIGGYTLAEVNQDIKDDLQKQINGATFFFGPGSKVETIRCLPPKPQGSRHASCAAMVTVESSTSATLGGAEVKNFTIDADGSYTWKAPKRWFL